MRLIPVIFLLVFALLIQNTCPHGFAGKSSVASSCSHCPQKQAHKQVFKGAAFSSISRVTAHPPLFVLDIPDTRPSFRLAALITPQPAIPNTYKDTAPKELLQPPRA